MCREFLLILLALQLCSASPGRTTNAGVSKLPKPPLRNIHWAVGHLMGKKSLPDVPDVDERRDPEQQAREPLHWDGAASHALRLIERNAQRSTQPPPCQTQAHHQPDQEAEDSSSFKDRSSMVKLVDSLFQRYRMRKNTHY